MLGSHAQHLAGWEAVHLVIKEELKIELVIFLRGGQHTLGHSCYGRHTCCLYSTLSSWRLCPMTFKSYLPKGRYREKNIV